MARRGHTKLSPDIRDELDSDRNPSWKLPANPYEPYGPPGAAWGVLLVSREPTAGGRLRHLQRPPSTQGWRWLAQQLQRPPFGASVTLRRLDENGRPTSYFELTIWARSKAPGWIRLSRDLPSDLLTSELHGSDQQRILSS